jgi:hypothetical protein
MPRTWLSFPIGRTGVRVGRSIADAELRSHLPSFRRYELRKGLQAAAEGRGEPMSREDCDYVIDKCLATGGLDSDGNPTLHVKGTREEIVRQIMETAGAWGQPMTRQQAEGRADAAIAAIESKREKWMRSIALIIGGLILVLLILTLVISRKSF